jgi:hypothetical protein
MVKVDQITDKNEIVQDFDQKLGVSEIWALISSLFGNSVQKDRKQFIVGGKVAILAANVTYLGIPHQLFTKRIQLKDYYPSYFYEDVKNGLHVVYLGIYTYHKTRLYVVFEPTTFTNKKSHNSSAHVHTLDLQYGMKKGLYRKTDRNGNTISVMAPARFQSYVEDLCYGKMDEDITYDDAIKAFFHGFFATLPEKWFGVECYMEMAAANYNNAKQSEWPGWYFEYLFQKYLESHPQNDIEWWSSKKEGDIDFDLKFPKRPWFYGDLKTDQVGGSVQGNVFDNVKTVIKDNNGRIWYVVMKFDCEKDSDHGYAVTKFWDELRGSKYDGDKKLMAERYGKKMKYSVTPKHFRILNLDKAIEEMLKANLRHQGHNSNGKPRPAKIQISKDIEDVLSILDVDFNKK